MAAEIIVVVEDEDAGGWPGGAAVEPGGRKPADAGTDHDEIVALLDRCGADRIAPALVRLRVRGLERAGVLAAQPGERGRITHRLRRSLGRGGQARGDGERRAVEEVASRNRGHARGFWQQSSAARKPPGSCLCGAPGLSRRKLSLRLRARRGPARDDQLCQQDLDDLAPLVARFAAHFHHPPVGAGA